MNPKAKLQHSLRTVTHSLFRQQGFAAASIILDWHLIVGEKFAEHCQPMKIVFPFNQRREGRLYVTASSALATEIAFLEPMILDKINRYFGYPAVAKIVVKHGNISKKSKTVTKRKTVAPEMVETHLHNIQDKQLYQALLDLGVGIFSDASHKK
jgi:hypothetical protein